MTSPTYRKLVQGTCGWSDQTLIQCGHFYPKKTMTAAEKLSFYSREGGFGCVEVDTSTYAIPSPLTIDGWVSATPKDFIFHFKVFGGLIQKGSQFNNIPKAIKDQLVEKFPTLDITNKYITHEMMGEDMVKQLWDIYNNALLPAFNSNKLGIVVFQFQNNFLPCESSYAHIKYCSENLDPRYTMAVEFRNRIWFNPDYYKKLLDFLKTLRNGNVALICCDDLHHELNQREYMQMVPNKDMLHCPIIIDLYACCKYVYVRVHRRFGEHRVLSDEEIHNWGKRLTNLWSLRETDIACSTEDLANWQPKAITDDSSSSTTAAPSAPPLALQGPVFFLWGTDWQDQPMTNANKLYNAVPSHINLSEKKILCRENRKNDIKNMFAKMAASPVKSTTAASNTPVAPTTAAAATTTGLSQESMHSTVSSSGSTFSEIAEARKAAAINAMFDSPTKNPRPETTTVSPLKRKLSATGSTATASPPAKSAAAASPLPLTVKANVTPTKVVPSTAPAGPVSSPVIAVVAASPSVPSTTTASSTSGVLSANVSPAKKRPEAASPVSTPVKKKLEVQSPASGKQSIMSYFSKK